MNIITEPAVYLVGYQSTDEAEIDRFLSDHNVTWETDTEIGSEALVETAGRVCYMSFAKPRPGGNAAYIQHIKEVGHGSVLEHGVWNFIFTGISRTLSHELVRHRAGWGYSQLSQRYVDESVCDVVVPEQLRMEVSAARAYLEATYTQPLSTHLVNRALDEMPNTPPIPTSVMAGLVWLRSCLQSNGDYRFLGTYLSEKLTKQFLETGEAGGYSRPGAMVLDNSDRTALRKEARQAARSVLPNATETKIFATANARALRHFVEMRAAKPAEPEIRKLAIAVLRILQHESPALFGDYTIHPLPDGTCYAETPYRKV